MVRRASILVPLAGLLAVPGLGSSLSALGAPAGIGVRAAGPSIVVSPHTVMAGDANGVTVTGSGFAPNEAVTVFYLARTPNPTCATPQLVQVTDTPDVDVVVRSPRA